MTGGERYAVIFRFPVVMGEDIWWLDEDEVEGDPRQGGKIFYRVPVVVPFKAMDFDFVLVVMHLTYTDLERREKELAALRDFLRSEDQEGDWIVLGDMNRYGEYKKSATNMAFDQLLIGDWKSKYRFPLLEAITAPDNMKVRKATEDKYSTTVSPENNVYDQIVITAGAFREFGTTDPQLGTHVGVIAFDMHPPWNTITDHNTVKYQVSDHRPVWARFRIDMGDDD